MKIKALVIAGVTALGLGGCAQAGSLGDILGGVLNSPSTSGTANVSGAEVQNIDTRNQRITIRTSNGQSTYVLYDSRTQLVYRNQQYNITSLEAGDVVAMRVTETNNREYYTDYIEVEQSAQDRGGYGSSGTTNNQQLYQMQGSVTFVDGNRGIFGVRTNNGDMTISLPYNPRSNVRDRFNNLRIGDYVRVEGYYVSNNRIEITRFF